jgi:hypothetical protein
MTVDVEDFLAHYASQYYDPQKAHDYYMETRQLKNENSGPQLSKEQRQKQTEGLSYAKNQIASKKKSDLESLDASTKAQFEKLQADAQAKVARISDSLNEFFAKLGDRQPTRGELKKIAFMQKQNNAIRKKVATELQAAVKNARESYRDGRKAIQTKYADAGKTEDANIRTQVR